MSAEIENKFGSIPQVEEESFYDTLPETIAKRVYGLKKLQAEQHEIEKKFHAEILAIEKKYFDLYKPILNKRSEIINGLVQPTEAEIAEGKKIADEDEEGVVKKGPKQDIREYTGIPEFWITCIKNNVTLAEIITERDEDALLNIKDIQVKYFEDGLGYKIIFIFAENEYFSNETLTKTYHYRVQEPSGTLGIDSCEGTEIQWKEGKDLTMITKARKQRNKDTNQTRVVKTTEPADSFFNFFATRAPLVDDDQNIDEEELEEYHSQLEQDFEIGEEFKDKIVTHAVDWYTGKALEYEGFDYGEDNYDEEGYDFGSSEEEGQVEELDDDETIEPKGEEQPECKQQ